MQTARLTLRSLSIDDAPRIADLAGDWDVASMTGRIPHPYSAEAALQWVEGLADGEVVFGIDYRDELIGICGFTRSADRSAEIGYWIGKPYWGRGFATEAAAALIAYGFAKCGVRRFTCCRFADNAASARVIEKLGFSELGPCEGWCEALQQNRAARRYERRRSWSAALKALAS